MKLVIDMNLSVDWGTRLRSAGHDAVHWSEIGAPAAPDDAIVAWAQANAACIVTRDLGFAAAITRAEARSPSVVQIRIERVRLDEHLPLVRRCLALHAAPIERGAIITLDEERVRIRVLDRDPQR